MVAITSFWKREMTLLHGEFKYGTSHVQSARYRDGKEYGFRVQRREPENLQVIIVQEIAWILILRTSDFEDHGYPSTIGFAYHGGCKSGHTKQMPRY